MGNLATHAENEMRLAGLYDDDADYGSGAIAGEVMKLVKALESGGHSGGSHGMTLAIFDKVARFQTLSPLTDSPDEWMDVGEYGKPEGSLGIWQSRRNPACFSNDGGKTYYDLDEKDRPLHETKAAEIRA
jgi:hypothetical protein